MPKTIEGVLTAIVTPFTATGSLNIPALKVQVNRQLEAPISLGLKTATEATKA